MKVLGVGLSRTGTLSLHKALQIVGYTNSIHFDTKRLNDVLDGSTNSPNFRRYDDIDTVTDLPSAYFYRELLDAYPDSKAILTVRDIDDWWRSIRDHFNFYSVGSVNMLDKIASGIGLKTWPGRNRFLWFQFMKAVRDITYGSHQPIEYIYKKRFIEHNERVQREVPSSRLLVIDIVAGDGWSELCSFLNVPIPSTPFPHTNRRKEPS